MAPERPDPAVGVYSISVAAELAGVGPQTLRLYESKGLVGPDRTSGGTRRYSQRDLDRVERIAALTADGLNLAGIKRVLDLEAETGQLRRELDALRGQQQRLPSPAGGAGRRAAPGSDTDRTAGPAGGARRAATG